MPIQPRKDSRLYCSAPQVISQENDGPIAMMRFHVQIHKDYRDSEEGDNLITQAELRIKQAAQSFKISPNIRVNYVDGVDNGFTVHIPFPDLGHVATLKAKQSIHQTVKDVMGAVDTPEKYPSH